MTMQKEIEEKCKKAEWIVWRGGQKWRGVEQWSWWFALIDRILSIVSRETGENKKLRVELTCSHFISLIIWPRGVSWQVQGFHGRLNKKKSIGGPLG